MICTNDENTGLLARRKWLNLKEAAKHFPGPSGKGIALPTIYRWTMYGVRGVKLRTAQVGSSRCTTLEWIEEFIAALTAARDGNTSEECRAVIRANVQPAVEAELDRIGV